MNDDENKKTGFWASMKRMLGWNSSPISEVTTDDKENGKTKSFREKSEGDEKSAELKSVINESVAGVDGKDKDTIKSMTISRISETSNENPKKESKEERRISEIMEVMDGDDKLEVKRDESKEVDGKATGS